jgi:hypothetical protein
VLLHSLSHKAKPLVLEVRCFSSNSGSKRVHRADDHYKVGHRFFGFSASSYTVTTLLRAFEVLVPRTVGGSYAKSVRERNESYVELTKDLRLTLTLVPLTGRSSKSYTGLQSTKLGVSRSSDLLSISRPMGREIILDA